MPIWLTDLVDSFGAWKDSWTTVYYCVATFTAISTVALLLFGARWTYRTYFQHRQDEQNAVLTLRPKPIILGNRYFLYLELDVQNIGNVMIKGDSYQITVVPLNGTTELPPLPLFQVQLTNLPNDWHYVLDNGEYNTFTGMFELPFGPGTAPFTACRIEAEFVSTKIVENRHVSWMRQVIHLCDTPVRAFSPGNPANQAKTEFDTLIDQLKESINKTIALIPEQLQDLGNSPATVDRDLAG